MPRNVVVVWGEIVAGRVNDRKDRWRRRVVLKRKSKEELTGDFWVPLFTLTRKFNLDGTFRISQQELPHGVEVVGNASPTQLVPHSPANHTFTSPARHMGALPIQRVGARRCVSKLPDDQW
jgi:hypothetical protein